MTTMLDVANTLLGRLTLIQGLPKLGRVSYSGVAVCCSVLQCVALRCRVLQFVALRCLATALQSVAMPVADRRSSMVVVCSL